uniref:Peroxisome biogenesis protein 22 n=1 Tax=Pyramimonas obovata TaxID=1411642 RepID=A0A7S0N215_9CHLO
MSDAIARILNNLSRTLGIRLTPWFESGAITWSGLLGLAAFLIGYYSFRQRHAVGASQQQQQQHARRATGGSDGASRGDTARGSGGFFPQFAQFTSTASQQNRSLLSKLHPSVQARLQGVQRVTCSLLGVLFEEKTPSDLSSRATVIPGAASTLKELAKICDVYMVTHCADDEGQQNVERALAELELLGTTNSKPGTGLIASHKSLFCSTREGKTAIVRQLEPDLHIDGCQEVGLKLAQFMPRIALIQPAAARAASPSNVAAFPALEDFLAAPQAVGGAAVGHQ